MRLVQVGFQARWHCHVQPSFSPALLAEAGAQTIFVSSYTDERQGFCRIRYCAQARASENQIYVAMAGTVGNLPEVPCMATHYGQAAILTPSDYFFARDGIAMEGSVNLEQLVISDIDLNLLDGQRLNGTVLPLNDLIRDVYGRVIHCTDSGEEQPLVSLPETREPASRLRPAS